MPRFGGSGYLAIGYCIVHPRQEVSRQCNNRRPSIDERTKQILGRADQRSTCGKTLGGGRSTTRVGGGHLPQLRVGCKARRSPHRPQIGRFAQLPAVGATARTNRKSLSAFGRFHRRGKTHPAECGGAPGTHRLSPSGGCCEETDEVGPPVESSDCPSIEVNHLALHQEN